MNDGLYPLITADSTFDAVILANGDYPTHAIPMGILERARLLACCDGAAAKAMDHGLMPRYVIGDGDSLPDAYKERLGERFMPLEDQSINDLTKTTRYCFNHAGGHHFAYLGTTGGREDHTIGNLSLMKYYLCHFGVRPTLITDHGYFVVVRGIARFESFPGQQVSVFNLGCKELTSSDLRWPVRPFDMLWQGTLNEATAERFTISTDDVYMVYRTFEAKPSTRETASRP